MDQYELINWMVFLVIFIYKVASVYKLKQLSIAL